MSALLLRITIVLDFFLFKLFLSLYKLKRYSKKECCKQCRHVKFKGTMTKLPVHKQTNTQNTHTHVEHQDATNRLYKPRRKGYQKFGIDNKRLT